MNKIALITGATSGIGKATATKLAEIGYDIIITGRRGDRLTALGNELKTKGIKVLALQFDVRNQQEVHNAISSLPEEWQNIEVLINNAGLAVGTSPIQEGIVDDWERMIDTNVKGLLYITHEVAPLMIKNEKGHMRQPCFRGRQRSLPGGNSVLRHETCR